MLRRIKKVRGNVLVWLTHRVALPILLLIRKPKEFEYSLNDLHDLSDGSLGKELALFIEANGLHLLKYYEKHDIKHVLFGYPSTEEGEVCLQFFMLGNGHVSFPVLITVIFGLLFMPEYYSLFIKAYKRGKRTPALKNVEWFDLVPQQLAAIRNQYQLTINSTSCK